MPTLPLKNLYTRAVILFAGMSFSDSKSSLTFVPWLSLSASDRHILSVTASRLQSRSFSLVSKSCEFLRNVLFKDFPAEIFLHRPNVLQVKYNNMIYLAKSNLTNDVNHHELSGQVVHKLRGQAVHNPSG